MDTGFHVESKSVIDAHGVEAVAKGICDILTSCKENNVDQSVITDALNTFSSSTPDIHNDLSYCTAKGV